MRDASPLAMCHQSQMCSSAFLPVIRSIWERKLRLAPSVLCASERAQKSTCRVHLVIVGNYIVNEFVIECERLNMCVPFPR